MAVLVWDLNRYVRLVRRFAEENECFAHQLRDRELLQLFHTDPRERQAEILAKRPDLIGDPFWDAKLTATAEHTAVLHGHPLPAWLDEPERFLDPPETRMDRLNDYLARRFCPPAWQRHGALTDPRELNPRGGERHEWIPGDWPWITPQEPCPWKPDWKPAAAAEVAALDATLRELCERRLAADRERLTVEDSEYLAELVRDGLL